jgi:uncharacterized protein (UPF0332 family)
VNESRDELIRHRLQVAESLLDDARYLAQDSRWNSCANRLYYACFTALTALLELENLSSRKHSGVRALFNQHFVKSGRLATQLAAVYNDLFEIRHQADYVDYRVFSREYIEPFVPRAEAFVNAVRQLLESSVSKDPGSSTDI